jgi:signal transduction histidine kinase
LTNDHVRSALRKARRIPRLSIERRRWEKALREKDIELQAAIVAKDRLLANMSHELRTPLTAIIGFTGTLLMRLPGPLNGEQVQQLTTIKTSAKQLLFLINNLLDLAQIDSGKVILMPDTVQCAALVNEVAASLAVFAAAKGLDLQVANPDAAITVRADRRVFSQILLNLVNNAINFTDRGHIRIDLARHEADGLFHIAVAVSDTGIGLTKGGHERIEAFAQFALSSTSRPEGAALGIHVSQKLARLMGGEITFVSVQGIGSTFTLTMPSA